MTAAPFAPTIKCIYGISPTQMITKTRITGGCRLLRETDASVAQIALNCGFADPNASDRSRRSAHPFAA